MAFKILEIVAPPRRAPQASISYRRQKNGQNRAAKPRLRIGIPEAVASTCDKNVKFEFLIGSGPDAGKARIVKGATAGVDPIKMNHGGLVFVFGYVPMLGDDAAEVERVPVKAVKDGFEIELPPWFKPDQAA